MEKKLDRGRIRRLAARLPRPTPLQQVMGRALDQAAYLRTRQALIAKTDDTPDALKNPEAKKKALAKIQRDMLQILGEASGARLPIERGLYLFITYNK